MKHLVNGVVFAIFLFGFQALFGVELELPQILILLAATFFGDVAGGVYEAITEKETETED